MIHFILIVGLLAGITGRFSPDPETRAMSGFFGAVCAIVAAVIWGSALIRWGLS
jgi:hypothetical protein